MLVAAMVGLDARATMDMDTTIKGVDVNLEEVENIIADIVSVPLEDGVTFRIKQVSEIMDEAEYPGVRVSMETEFDGVRTPLKIDISTGDVITPKEMQKKYLRKCRKILEWRNFGRYIRKSSPMRQIYLGKWLWNQYGNFIA